MLDKLKRLIETQSEMNRAISEVENEGIRVCNALSVHILMPDAEQLKQIKDEFGKVEIEAHDRDYTRHSMDVDGVGLFWLVSIKPEK